MYNSLNKFVRRIYRCAMKYLIENKRVLMVVVIAIAFQIFLAGVLQDNIGLRILLTSVGVALFLFGIYLYIDLGGDIKRAQANEAAKEEQNQAKREQQHKELLAELKGIRKDLRKR